MSTASRSIDCCWLTLIQPLPTCTTGNTSSSSQVQSHLCHSSLTPLPGQSFLSCSHLFTPHSSYMPSFLSHTSVTPHSIVYLVNHSSVIHSSITPHLLMLHANHSAVIPQSNLCHSSFLSHANHSSVVPHSLLC